MLQRSMGQRAASGDMPSRVHMFVIQFWALSGEKVSLRWTKPCSRKWSTSAWERARYWAGIALRVYQGEYVKLEVEVIKRIHRCLVIIRREEIDPAPHHPRTGTRAHDGRHAGMRSDRQSQNAKRLRASVPL
jgi:hypothetical protein